MPVKLAICVAGGVVLLAAFAVAATAGPSGRAAARAAASSSLAATFSGTATFVVSRPADAFGVPGTQETQTVSLTWTESWDATAQAQNADPWGITSLSGTYSDTGTYANGSTFSCSATLSVGASAANGSIVTSSGSTTVAGEVPFGATKVASVGAVSGDDPWCGPSGDLSALGGSTPEWAQWVPVAQDMPGGALWPRATFAPNEASTKTASGSYSCDTATQCGGVTDSVSVSGSFGIQSTCATGSAATGNAPVSMWARDAGGAPEAQGDTLQLVAHPGSAAFVYRDSGLVATVSARNGCGPFHFTWRLVKRQKAKLVAVTPTKAATPTVKGDKGGRVSSLPIKLRCLVSARVRRASPETWFNACDGAVAYEVFATDSSGLKGSQFVVFDWTPRCLSPEQRKQVAEAQKRIEEQIVDDLKEDGLGSQFPTDKVLALLEAEALGPVLAAKDVVDAQQKYGALINAWYNDYLELQDSTC